jgi:hypothetical protein
LAKAIKYITLPFPPAKAGGYSTLFGIKKIGGLQLSAI